MPLLIDGVIYASIITLLAIGFTLTYLTSRIPNFAQGTFASVGVYVTFTVTRIWGLNVYVAVPLGFILSALIATLVYKGVLGILKKHGASIVSLMISTLAVELLLLASINIYADTIQTRLRVISRTFLLRYLDFSFMGYPGIFIVSITLVLSLIIGLYLLLNRTKFGIAMRATVEDPDLASTLGVNVELVSTVSWFLTGGLAGIAGCLIPLWFQSDPNAGSKLLVSVFAASVLGGLSSIYGAILGGYVIGLTETLGNSILTRLLGGWVAYYRLLIPLTILCLTLLYAPRGLAGIIESVQARGYRLRLIRR
ncbi:MAG: branched-chain amino acid ABC transporter permease, partial [Candidatus Bathyarchaeia archaeon]